MISVKIKNELAV